MPKPKPKNSRAKAHAKLLAGMFGPTGTNTNRAQGQPAVAYSAKTGKIDHSKSVSIRFPEGGSAAAVKKARALAKKTQRPLPKKKKKK